MAAPLVDRKMKRKNKAGASGQGRGKPRAKLDLKQRLQDGLRRQMAGDLAAAEAAYREILSAEPRHPDALHLLGVTKLQAGQPRQAVDMIRRAVAESPDNADYHGNLSAALLHDGQAEAAAEECRTALRLNPNNAGFHSNLAVALRRLGQPRAAIDSYEAAVRLNPTAVHLHETIGELYLGEQLYAEARDSYQGYLAQAADDPKAHKVHNNLGHAEEKLGNLEAAEACYSRALALQPEDPDYLNNVALMKRARNRRDEALALLRKACALAPDRWKIAANLASICLDLGRGDEAVAILREQLPAHPNESGLWYKFGLALAMAGEMKAAQEAFLNAIELDPDDASFYHALSGCFFSTGDPAGAYAALRKVLELRPRHLEAHLVLCECLQRMGRPDEANIRAHAAVMLESYQPQNFAYPLKAFRHSCDFDGIDELGDVWATADRVPPRMLPQAFLHMLVMADTPERNDHLVRLHRKWGGMLEERAKLTPLPPFPAQRPGGRIRIGFLSSDLNSHSVAKCMMPLFESFDRERFEIRCYSPRQVGDAIEQKIAGLVTDFKFVENEPDPSVAATIRADDIDILFDLNGITQHSRTGVMAYRPAPVQIEWLGYPFTCGISQIDYMIADRFIRPTRDELLVETPLELPGAWICFTDMGQVDVDPTPPCLKTGQVTFGTLNNPYKYTRAAVAAWAKVMNAVPESRFLLVRWRDGSTLMCHHLVAEFAKHGVSSDRLFFMRNPAGMHLQCYNEIDISLDTFPLTGGTTTCDALWMGVPVVSLAGEGFHQRISHAILNHAGLGDLSRTTIDGYVETAVALARDPDRLGELRRTLRQTLLDSDMFRRDRFVPAFQDAMEALVRRHGLRQA
jgi:protein O-GlcNAc transferase